MENGEAIDGKTKIVVSHAFSFLSSRSTIIIEPLPFALSYCTTKDSFSTQYHPQVLGSVFDFSRNHRQELILKIWHLISVLCSILRSIIYALSEPQMGLGKSRRKNLRPSFENFSFFQYYIFF